MHPNRWPPISDSSLILSLVDTEWEGLVRSRRVGRRLTVSREDTLLGYEDSSTESLMVFLHRSYAKSSVISSDPTNQIHQTGRDGVPVQR